MNFGTRFNSTGIKLSRLGYATSSSNAKKYKLVIVGGGAGGLTVANRLSNAIGKENIAIVEPSKSHYYQPLWTLVGAGIYPIEQSAKLTEKFIPPGVTWMQNKVKAFKPQENVVELDSGEKIAYEYLLISIGMQLRYDQIKGAEAAFAKDPRVCSNYTYDFCQKTFEAFKQFPKNGTAVFSHPNSPVKCGGAPQKVMFLFDDYLRKNNLREGAKIEFVISLPGMFAVPKYSESLAAIATERGIIRHHRSHVVEIEHEKSLVTIQNLDNKSVNKIKYDLLHVVPPMCSPEVISSNADLTTPESGGYVAVDIGTLRSKKFQNVFSLGDCAAVPTSKTAAAVASQSDLVSKNLVALMAGARDEELLKYDGYTSCPLITGYDRGIIAEFGYENKILETTPLDQSKERFIFGWIKKTVLPHLYWDLMLHGNWPGPKHVRKILHLGK